MNKLKGQVLNGVVWTFIQQFSVQIINFVVQIILARLLLPEDFGLIAMLTVFISIGQMLMDGGMTSSIIRMKSPTQLDYSTVFVTNLLMSILIYLIVFLVSPSISVFYDQEILKDILRVYALTFVIRSFVAVHLAKLTKEMNFKTQTKLQIPSTIVGALVGIIMAYSGYGVWSLVFLNISQTIIFTLQSWIFIPWKPTLVFDKKSFNYHFNFGYKLTISSLIDTIYKNIYNVIIGKFFTPALAGFYNQADTMRNLPVIQMASVLDKVTYPLFSNIDNKQQLKIAYQKVMKLSFMVSVPMMLFLLVTAEELFLLLFGEKWLAAVPYFQILSFASIIRPLHSYNLNILKVSNKSALFLKLEVIKKIIGVIAILVTIPFGIIPLVYGYTIAYYIMLVPSMYYSGIQIDYKMREQINDCYKIFLIGVLTGVIIYYMKIFLINTDILPLLLMFMLFVAYLLVYVLLLLLFNRSLLYLALSLFKK